MTEDGTSRERWPEPLPGPSPETFTFDEGLLEFTFANIGERVDVYAQFESGLGLGPARKVAEFEHEDQAVEWVYSLDDPSFTWARAQAVMDEAAALFMQREAAAQRRADMRLAYAAHYREHPEDLGEHNPYL